MDKRRTVGLHRDDMTVEADGLGRIHAKELMMIVLSRQKGDADTGANALWALFSDLNHSRLGW